jgi:hypothetical protein
MGFRAYKTCSPLNCFYVCLALETAPRILINPPEFYLNSGENMLEVKKWGELNKEEQVSVTRWLLKALTQEGAGAKADLALADLRRHASEGELYIDIEKTIKVEMLERRRGCGYTITEVYILRSVRNAIVLSQYQHDPIEPCLVKYIVYIVPYSTLQLPTFSSVIIYRRSNDPLIPSGDWRLELGYDGEWRKDFIAEED